MAKHTINSILILSTMWLSISTGSEPVKAQPRLAYQAARDLTARQAELRKELRNILALDEQPDAKVEWTAKRVFSSAEYTMDRIEFTAEPDQRVPGYLLRPTKCKPPYRVMICLQGHSPGVHVSIGRANPQKLEKVSPAKGDRDFAMQAVQHGWAALAIEQRGFGERAVQDAS